MAIESLSNFKSSFANLPIATAAEFPANLADWFEDNILILALAGVGGAGLSFSFDKSTLITQLTALPTTPQPEASAIAALANCFVSSLTSSTYNTQVGTYLSEPPLPANTFGSVTSTTPNTSSVGAKIEEMIGTDPDSVQDVDDSPFPEKIRDAVLTILITTIGFDQTPPATGPLPLTDAARSVI